MLCVPLATWLLPPRLIPYAQMLYWPTVELFPPELKKSCLTLPFTHQRHAPVYDYRIFATAPRVTTPVANHPPFTDPMYPPRDFSPLAPLRASRSMSSPTTSAPKTNNRTALPSPLAPRPPLDLSPVPSTDIRGSTGPGTGRTPGLRPAAPLPRAFPTTTDGPLSHLGHLAPIWDSLESAQQAAMERVSFHDVEEGLAHARVSEDNIARTIANKHALNLATAEHERLTAPLRTKLTTLNRHSATARSGLQDITKALEETTRVRGRESRLASLEAQTRSTAAALAAAERNHASFLSGLSAQQPDPPNSATLVAPAAQQTLAPAPLATSVAPTARQPPASANLATSVAPAARQPALANVATSVTPPVPQLLALDASTVSTAPAATRPLCPTALAATRPLATVPPAVTFSARPTMPPPAPREPSSSAPWEVVVSRAHRQPQPQPPSTARDDSHLELRVSKLMFRNKFFPSDLRLPIKELASDVHAALHQLTGDRRRLHHAVGLATQDRTPLSDRVVEDILHRGDLLETACGTPAGAQWVRETLRDAATKHRTDRTDSFASDSSTTTGQRRREDPSSGRGNAKRATSSGTSDSDSGQQPRHAGRDRLDKRQVPPYIFHAAERNGNDAPPFPPRI